MPSSPAHLSYVGLTLVDRYRVDELLAQGALSQVFRGQDAVLRRGVVIKVVPHQHAIAFQSALHATAALTHPAIIAVFDAIEHDDSYFVVQEYVRARPFGAYLPVGLPVERATDLASQLARVLAYAHAHGVAHGDLTPAAILVDRRAVLRLNNFALPPDAAYFDSFAHALQPPDATLVAPTSPSPYTDDVRAVGLILWQALSVAHPADAIPDNTDDTDTDNAEDAEDADRAFRADVPENARALVRRLLVRAHPEHITDAETLLLELEALARDLARLRSPLAEDTPPALRVAREMIQHDAPWSLEDTVGASHPWATSDDALGQAHSGNLGGSTAPAIFAASGSNPEPRRALASGPRFPPRISLPSRPMPAMPRDGAPPFASRSLSQATDQLQATESGPPLALALLLGGALFLVFFLIGFFILH